MKTVIKAFDYTVLSAEFCFRCETLPIHTTKNRHCNNEQVTLYCFHSLTLVQY